MAVNVEAAARPSGSGERLVRLLLDWFDRCARDLPWRRIKDPYGIWVAEVMLQQTQVKTVIPYWERWMSELPSVGAVAAASLDRVLRLWEGLGYYSRARRMHEAARLIEARHGGEFPRDYEGLRALPGLGHYSAGAIGSIAYDLPTPVVDANAARVLARLFAVRGPVQHRVVQARLWEIARKLVAAAGEWRAEPGRTTQVPAAKPAPHETSGGARVPCAAGPCGRFNQALMELGAVVCTPKKPRCAQCPVRSLCVAYKQRLTALIPAAALRRATVLRRVLAFVAERKGRFLVSRRDDEGVNAGLWEFPTREPGRVGADPGSEAEMFFGRGARALSRLCCICHSITRHRIVLEAYRVRLPRRMSIPRDVGTWRSLERMEDMPFSAAHRKIVRELARARSRKSR